MKQTPEELAASVQERLAQAGLAPYGLKVRCVGKDVTLQGIVDVLAEKTLAGEVAARIPGVGRVENAITVCTDGKIDDEDVAAEVAEELAADPLAPGVGAEVTSGRVRLVGQVSTVAAAAKAIATASKARGVREVTSELSLAPGMETDDASLANAVGSTLADWLGSSAGRIEITVHGGIVTLAGDGIDEEIAAQAERAAANVPGVRGVRTNLHRGLRAHDKIICDILDRIGADPFLNQESLRFTIRNGRLIVEGEVDDQGAKRNLDKALHETLAENRLELHGLDNRVRVDR